MFRITLVFAAVAALASGCAAGTAQHPTGPAPVPATSAAPAAAPAAPSPRAVPGATGSDELVLSLDGIGPFRLGTRGATLRAAGLLGSASPVDARRCPDLSSVAVGAGPFAGTVLVVLRHDVLVEIGTAGGEPIRSPEGVGVGSSWDEVRAAYGERGSMRKDSQGHQGFIVPVGDTVMLFAGNPIRPGVGWFAVGKADLTLHAFLTGKPC